MLTLQFVPYSDMENLDSDGRIKKVLGLVKEEKIVLMQGRLKPIEETQLIEQTMEILSKTFKGIEICTIYPENKNKQLFTKMKKELIKFLIGDRDGFTVIGPATVVKEIKRDPNKILLLTDFPKRRKRRK